MTTFSDRIQSGELTPDDPEELGDCAHCPAPAETTLETVPPGAGDPVSIAVCLACYGARYAPVEGVEPGPDEVPF